MNRLSEAGFRQIAEHLNNRPDVEKKPFARGAFFCPYLRLF